MDNNDINQIHATQGKTVLRRINPKKMIGSGILHYYYEQDMFIGQVINTGCPLLSRGQYVMFYRTIDITELKDKDTDVIVAIVYDNNIFLEIELEPGETEKDLLRIEIR